MLRHVMIIFLYISLIGCLSALPADLTIACWMVILDTFKFLLHLRTLPFLLMCDASDYAIGAVLGQKVEKTFRVIYYASMMLNTVQQNYTTVEKELLVVVFALEMFRPYLLGAKVVVYS